MSLNLNTSIREKKGICWDQRILSIVWFCWYTLHVVPFHLKNVYPFRKSIVHLCPPKVGCLICFAEAILFILTKKIQDNSNNTSRQKFDFISNFNNSNSKCRYSASISIKSLKKGQLKHGIAEFPEIARPRRFHWDTIHFLWHKQIEMFYLKSGHFFRSNKTNSCIIMETYFCRIFDWEN